MLRYQQQPLCFPSYKNIKNATDSTPNAPAKNVVHLKSLRSTPSKARASPSSPDKSTSCPTTSNSDADTITSITSATSEGPSLPPEALTKTPAAPWQDWSTPYVPILQPDGTLRPPRISFGGYGSFGGRFAPESIMDFLTDLTSSFEATISDPAFWTEYAAFQRQQPTPLHIAPKLTAMAGGATIWLKREDLNDYGSHKTRNILGQLLLARRMGRTEIVTDCASAKHGSFTAAMCARLGLHCVIAIGADDAEAQPEDVLEMKMLGAKVLAARAPSGMGSLRAAITEALRYSVSNYESAYYLMGSPVGPSPLPTLARTFQALLGEEVAVQMQATADCQPDAVVTAVGSGSGAVGLFRPFLQNSAVRLVGVEAAQAAALTQGEVGVLQGARTLMLQNDDGQILDSHSISPDLNLSTVGPEVAHWKSIGRVEIQTATDADALDGFKTLQHHEGMLVGLDSSHAVGRTVALAKELGPGKNIVLLVTGCDGVRMRGSLDV